MFKFTAGIVVGWVAARSLDDKKKMMPTTDELSRLKTKATIFYEHTVRKIEEYDKK
jgi:hypothetical protein